MPILGNVENQNLSFEGFFPSAYHVILGNPYAQNIIRKENPLQNHTLTAISYTKKTAS